MHEVKHDGYRLMVRRAGARVRLFTRRGHDWSDRYPRIAEAMARLRIASATIDGEAVIWGPDGADFDKLHGRAHDGEAILIAFDLLELDGEDLRREPFETRKARQLATRMPAGPAHQRAPAVSWRRGLPSRLQDGPGRHRLKTFRLALSVGPDDRLAQIR